MGTQNRVGYANILPPEMALVQAPRLHLESIDIDMIERRQCLFADSRRGPNRRPPGRRSCSGGDGEPPRSKIVFIT